MSQQNFQQVQQKWNEDFRRVYRRVYPLGVVLTGVGICLVAWYMRDYDYAMRLAVTLSMAGMHVAVPIPLVREIVGPRYASEAEYLAAVAKVPTDDVGLASATVAIAR